MILASFYFLIEQGVFDRYSQTITSIINKRNIHKMSQLFTFKYLLTWRGKSLIYLESKVVLLEKRYFYQ